VIRNGEVTEQFFSIESKPIGLLLFEKQVVIAAMNNTLHSFYMKGKKNFAIQMPDNILDITKLDMKRTQQGGAQCVIVSLANGEIRLINPKDKNLIHILKSEVRCFINYNYRSKRVEFSMESLDEKKVV
jgi:hypothetical protein